MYIFTISVSVVNADIETFHSIIENLSPAGEKRPDACNGAVCFSNGYVCSGEMDGTDFDEMVREADRRMYENKKAFYRMHQNMDQREKFRQIIV